MLIRAAKYGRTACLQLLLDAGANKEATCNVRENRRTSLSHIFIAGHWSRGFYSGIIVGSTCFVWFEL